LFAEAARRWPKSRNRIMCGGACAPSVDVAFQDYWPATPADDAFVDACYSAARRPCCPMQPIRPNMSLV
jgi:hypothetical protein